MVVQHNMQAVNTNRMLGQNVKAVAKNTEKLSSGYAVNRAADDAAGLSISEKMRNQIRGLNQSVKNAEDGISLIQTAEGNMNEIHSILQRMGELAIKSRNDVNASEDRRSINDEIVQLKAEISSITKKAEFNGTKLLNGEMSGGKNLQVGAESNTSNKISVTIKNMGVSTLATTFDTMLTKMSAATTLNTATAVVNKFLSYCKLSSGAKVNDTNMLKASFFAGLNVWAKSAIQDVSEQRSDLGAIQNRLEHTINNLDNVVENTTAAESQIWHLKWLSILTTISLLRLVRQCLHRLISPIRVFCPYLANFCRESNETMTTEGNRTTSGSLFCYTGGFYAISGFLF